MHDSAILGIQVPDTSDLPDVTTHLAGIVGGLEERAVIPCTSADRPTPVEGMTVYETDTNLVRVYDGTRWFIPGVAICTSGTRPSSPYRGMTVFETDTGNTTVYYGATMGWRPPWNTAWGILDDSSEPAAHNGFTTTPGEIHANCRVGPFTAVGSRRVKVSINCVLQIASSAAAGFTLDVYESGSPVSGGRLDQCNSINQFGFSAKGWVNLTPSAGTHTYQFYIAATAGSAGLINVAGSSTFPITTSVEDIGPVGERPDMSDLWLPGFERCIGSHSSGGTYISGVVYRWTGHTTEGLSRDPAGAARSHPTPPHCWVTLPSHPYKPRWRGQIVPLNRSAFALKHNAGDPETNKAGAIQVEIEGFSAQAGTWSAEDNDWLADEVVGPMCEAMGIDVTLTWPTRDVDRMPWDTWRRFGGLCCHRNVPGNVHTDAPINLRYISERLTHEPPPPPTPQPPEDDMATLIVSKKSDPGTLFIAAGDLSSKRRIDGTTPIPQDTVVLLQKSGNVKNDPADAVGPNFGPWKVWVLNDPTFNSIP